MPPPKTAPRKRARKRKRRADVSSSSSSSDDEDSSSSQSIAPAVKAATTISESSSSESDSDSDSDNSSIIDNDNQDANMDVDIESTALPKQAGKSARRELSPTPPPRSVDVPSLLPETGEEQDILKQRFRKFWMSSVAEAFKDDLEIIRNEPKFTTGRLEMLIESLAAGSDVYQKSNGESSEMQILLDST